jgi:hypothetical protein
MQKSGVPTVAVKSGIKIVVRALLVPVKYEDSVSGHGLSITTIKLSEYDWFKSGLNVTITSIDEPTSSGADKLGLVVILKILDKFLVVILLICIGAFDSFFRVKFNGYEPPACLDPKFRSVNPVNFIS